MFTGIVEAVGSVVSVEDAGPGLLLMVIEGPPWLSEVPAGASVAVDGVCLTVTKVTSPSSAAFEVMAQTLRLTALGSLGAGNSVNLERSLPVTGRLDGHLVQGHVDGVGELLSERQRGADVRWRISMPTEIEALVATRGSICVSGVSLTVADVSAAGSDTAWFEVALIPATLKGTTFGAARVGQKLHLEADVVARYGRRLAEVISA